MPEAIITAEQAIENISKHNLRSRVEKSSGRQAHQILPDIWPIINELLVLTDACEKGAIQISPKD